jgi:hypothetical protein
MSRLYSSKEVRLESPFPKALKKMRQELSDLPDQVRQNIRERTDRGTGEARRVLRKLKQVASEVTSPRRLGGLSRSSSLESFSSPEGGPASTSPPESSADDVDTE